VLQTKALVVRSDQSFRAHRCDERAPCIIESRRRKRGIATATLA
jgi:hypothetical protein